MANLNIVSVSILRLVALGSLAVGTIVTVSTVPGNGVIVPNSDSTKIKIAGVVLTAFDAATLAAAGNIESEVDVATLNSGIIEILAHENFPAGTEVIATNEGRAASMTRTADAATPSTEYTVLGIATEAGVAGGLVPVLMISNRRVTL